MCDIDLGDVCEVWVPTKRLANKIHICAACGGSIQPGDRYHHTFAIFEGDASTSKHCGACERDIQAFGRAHEHQTPHPRSLTWAVEACIDNADSPSEARRWKAMLARIRARARGGAPREAP